MPNTAIQFYHLLTTPITVALPKLLEKAISTNMKVTLLVDDNDINIFDKILWEYSQDSFLPHGTASTLMPDFQPVYITNKLENPNNATLLIITNGTEYEINSMKDYERIFDIFDGGNKDMLQAARNRWKKYSDAKYQLTYIQQNEKGGWITKN